MYLTLSSFPSIYPEALGPFIGIPARICIPVHRSIARFHSRVRPRQMHPGTGLGLMCFAQPGNRPEASRRSQHRGPKTFQPRNLSGGTAFSTVDRQKRGLSQTCLKRKLNHRKKTRKKCCVVAGFTKIVRWTPLVSTGKCADPRKKKDLPSPLARAPPRPTALAWHIRH